MACKDVGFLKGGKATNVQSCVGFGAGTRCGLLYLYRHASPECFFSTPALHLGLFGEDNSIKFSGLVQSNKLEEKVGRTAVSTARCGKHRRLQFLGFLISTFGWLLDGLE